MFENYPSVTSFRRHAEDRIPGGNGGSGVNRIPTEYRTSGPEQLSLFPEVAQACPSGCHEPGGQPHTHDNAMNQSCEYRLSELLRQALLQLRETPQQPLGVRLTIQLLYQLGVHHL